MQYGGGFSVDFFFPLQEDLALDTSIEGFTVAPSDVSGDFLYRGYSGGAMALMVQVSRPLLATRSFGSLRGGGSLGLGAALPSYWYTTLAFFYLEPRAEGFLDWQPAFLRNFSVQLFLPLRMELRRDMDYSLTTGIGLRIYYQFGSGSRKQ